MMAGSSRKNDVNKKEIGARIKKLRKEAGLRQWQLAEMVGATQPAIHMYERGVLPEPRRLLELARIGNTTVEWILTGRHWENGSEEMPRVPEEVYELAFLLKEYSPEDRETLESAVRALHQAAEAVNKGGEPERLTVDEIARLLKEAMSSGTIQTLSSAMRAHGAVSRSLASEGATRYRRLQHEPAAGDGPNIADPDAAGRRKSPYRMRSTSFEPVRGHIFRADGSFLVVQELLRDKDLRTELEDALGRLSAKLDSKRSRIGKLKKAQRGKQANR